MSLDLIFPENCLDAAVDKVRKEQWRALNAEGRKVVKGLSWRLAMYSTIAPRAIPGFSTACAMQSAYPPRPGAQGLESPI